MGFDRVFDGERGELKQHPAGLTDAGTNAANAAGAVASGQPFVLGEDGAVVNVAGVGVPAPVAEAAPVVDVVVEGEPYDAPAAPVKPKRKPKQKS